MKLPISFGNRLFFRLLIPGFLIASLIAVLFGDKILGDDPIVPKAAFFTLGTIGAGFVILLLDQQIYMLLEGRKYWPELIRRLGMWRQKRLLQRWQMLGESDLPRSIEYQVLAQRYPIDDARYPPSSGEPGVMMPTELGNVIYGFETYPKTKYGLDGVFFWPRIWMTVDKDLRSEIDEAQSVADCATYCTAILATAAVVLSALLAVQTLSDGRIEIVPQYSGAPWYAPLLSIAAMFAASRVFYRLSISTNTVFGEKIKAMYDGHIDKISLEPALTMIAERTGHDFSTASDASKRMAAWRYLRWHTYRADDDQASENIEEFISRRVTRDGGADTDP